MMRQIKLANRVEKSFNFSFHVYFGSSKFPIPIHEYSSCNYMYVCAFKTKNILCIYNSISALTASMKARARKYCLVG